MSIDLSRVVIYARDKTGTRVAVVDEYTSIAGGMVFDDMGDWTLSGIPDGSTVAEALLFADDSRGRQGIEITLDEASVFSGAVVETELDDISGLWEFRGIDDTGRLANAYCSPDPVNRPPWTQASDDFFASAQYVVAYCVTRNIAQFALPERQEVIPGLVVPIESDLGSDVTYSGRPDRTVLQALQEICAPDGLRFRILPDDANGGALTLTTRLPLDKRDTILFSREMANIGEAKLIESAATANALVVMAGQDTTRQASKSDEASVTRYGRVEGIVDRSDQDTVEAMLAAADDELGTSVGGFDITFQPETDALEWPRDYDLGTRVTAQVRDIDLDAYVSEIRFEITGGESGACVVTPTVTTTAAAKRSTRASGLSRSNTRISRLEVNQGQNAFPSGMGMIWTKPLVDFPYPGWQVSDGTNSTLDLTGGVLYGAGGLYALGDVLGDNTPALPAHDHGIALTDLAHPHNDAGHVHPLAATHDHPAGGHVHPIAATTVNVTLGATPILVMTAAAATAGSGVTATSNAGNAGTGAANIQNGAPAGSGGYVSTSTTSATTVDVRQAGTAVYVMVKL